MKMKAEGFNNQKRRRWGRALPLTLAAGALIALNACAAQPPAGSAGGSSQPAVSEPAAPSSVTEIANKWAQAVKDRNGKAQYDLMTPALQESVFQEFSGLNWVTGTSSPWVERYSVEETDAGARVILEYASSTGSEGSYRQDLTFEKADDGLKISGISQPVAVDDPADDAAVLDLSDLTGLLGMTRDQLTAAMGDETPVSVDEGGLGFEKSGIRVWFDDATHTKVAQVFVMTDDIDLNGVHRGDSLATFEKTFGKPLIDDNADARFAYKDVYLSVIHDTASKSDEVVGVYVLQENL